MHIYVDDALCTGCGCCVLICQEGAVDTRPSFIAGIDAELCTACLVCLDHCPNRALLAEE